MGDVIRFPGKPKRKRLRMCDYLDHGVQMYEVPIFATPEQIVSIWADHCLVYHEEDELPDGAA